MFIKCNTRWMNGKRRKHYLLVESVKTEKGPRHRVICNLGTEEPCRPERRKELAAKLEMALAGQLMLGEEEDEEFKLLYRRIELLREKERQKAVAAEEKRGTGRVKIDVDSGEMAFENAREAGPVHVGHQMWEKLGVGEILSEVGLDSNARILAELLTLNRLIEPSSDYATPDWVERTALADMLGENVEGLNYRVLYSCLDALHQHKGKIEKALADREASLFNLDTTIFLYDLTSTYFEGTCLKNEAGKHGYSRDKRADCKQVVVGLVLNRDGFPRLHETFEGNRTDCTTVEDMLRLLSERTGGQRGLTVTVDRGMADAKTLAAIKAHGHHYLVAAKQTERAHWLAEFEDEEGWVEVVRQPSATNPYQKKPAVKVKRFDKGEQTYVLCIGEGRVEKDRAIREKQEIRLLKDLEKLKERVNSGNLKAVRKVYEAIGRLKERYPRVARYYEIEFDEKSGKMAWVENAEKKKKAIMVDGGYLLKTDRKDLSDTDVWQTYMLLTRVESAFRDMKGPLGVRPVYHQLQRRVEAHIFVCVLAYNILVSIEMLLHDAGITSSWETIRKQLGTHQVVSAQISTGSGKILEIRKDTTPTGLQKQIYRALAIPERVFSTPRRRWLTQAG